MRVAVVTPYYREDEAILLQCRESVVAQTHSCEHIFVADGFPNSMIDTWHAFHIKCSTAHADVGNTPRVLGALSAFSLGFDAVAFLDADNWYTPDHVERMVALHRRTSAAVCTSARAMYRPNGSYMFDDDKCDGRTHVDTNCFFLTRRVIGVLSRWAMMPPELGPIGDTVYFESIKQRGLSHAHHCTPTVCYRTTWESDFRRLAEHPPEGAKTSELTDEPFRWIRDLPSPQRAIVRQELGWPPTCTFRLLKKVMLISAKLQTRHLGRGSS